MRCDDEFEAALDASYFSVSSCGVLRRLAGVSQVRTGSGARPAAVRLRSVGVLRRSVGVLRRSVGVLRKSSGVLLKSSGVLLKSVIES